MSVSMSISMQVKSLGGTIQFPFGLNGKGGEDAKAVQGVNSDTKEDLEGAKEAQHGDFTDVLAYYGNGEDTSI